MKIVRAYWRLVEAAADYTFCRDHVKGLERVRTGGRGEASLRLAATTATAQLRDAGLAAVRRQYELAEVTRLPAGSSPPLPADSPLVLRYDTKFDQLFAARTPPEGARLSDKTLPIQHQAIEDRAAAVQAAEDASAAVTENYRDGRGDSAAVVACSRELLRQQRAFIETVCAYNRNIADYALLVVPTTTTPQELVTILLGPNAKTGGPAGAGWRPGRARAPRHRADLIESDASARPQRTDAGAAARWLEGDRAGDGPAARRAEAGGQERAPAATAAARSAQRRA